MTFVAIDFEASCLPRHGRSFPIEVGISDGRCVRSWLILPHADWTGWDWTPEAAAIHGITRDQLAAEGLPARRVLSELLAAVDGRRLVADSPLDQYWLDTLAAAAGYGPVPVIDKAATLLDRWNVTADQVVGARQRADRRMPRRHRAACDAEWLHLVLADLAEQVERAVEAVA